MVSIQCPLTYKANEIPASPPDLYQYFPKELNYKIWIKK